jgi:hypothetical protein
MNLLESSVERAKFVAEGYNFAIPVDLFVSGGYIFEVTKGKAIKTALNQDASYIIYLRTGTKIERKDFSNHINFHPRG